MINTHFLFDNVVDGSLFGNLIRDYQKQNLDILFCEKNENERLEKMFSIFWSKGDRDKFLDMMSKDVPFPHPYPERNIMLEADLDKKDLMVFFKNNDGKNIALNRISLCCAEYEKYCEYKVAKDHPLKVFFSFSYFDDMMSFIEKHEELFYRWTEPVKPSEEIEENKKEDKEIGDKLNCISYKNKDSTEYFISEVVSANYESNGKFLSISHHAKGSTLETIHLNLDFIEYWTIKEDKK